MDPGQISAAAKRSRQSASKVRTGCNTCKARRVKCDEAEPVCRRCAIGRRTCEYSVIRPARQSRPVMTIYLAPAQSQPSFFTNDQGLAFFHGNLAATLDGQFGSDFWGKLVLQLSHSEDSIRHSVSAISAIYQDVEASLRHPAGYVKANPEGQRRWNRAVKSLTARIQTHPDSHLVPLICCLLFTCIELLWGNDQASLMHAQNGFNMLSSVRGNLGDAPHKRSALSSSEQQAIEEHIVPMFSRLSVLCALAGKMNPPLYAQSYQEDTPHKDLAHSRQRLVEISNVCIQFIGMSSGKAATFDIDVDDCIEQVKLLTRLQTWRSRLSELLRQKQSSLACSGKQDALHLLLTHYKVIYIWTSVCTSAAETATDTHHADFEELVHHAEQVVTGNKKLNKTPNPLSFDMHVLGPLYFAALKCRHPTTRRRALELLKWAPRREGLWSGHHAYATAQRIIELEERNISGQEWPHETARLHGLILTDDGSRIYDPAEMPFDFRKLDHSIVPSPAYPGTVKAEFQLKPWGLSGDWDTITEYINL